MKILLLLIGTNYIIPIYKNCTITWTKMYTLFIKVNKIL